MKRFLRQNARRAKGGSELIIAKQKDVSHYFINFGVIIINQNLCDYETETHSHRFYNFTDYGISIPFIRQ
jgi:hypothetical protein